MKNLFVFVAAVCAASYANAQSTHFSQFYSTPLLINPASTGLTPGPYRVSANYRTQWNNAGSPYKTLAISGDAQVMKDRLAEGNILGIGLAIVNDQTLQGAVQSNSLALSAGYHIALDEYQSVGVGFQGTYNEKRIDFSRLDFENQFNGGGFDPSIPTGEALGDGKKYYLDLNAGGMYSFSGEDRSFFAGGAVFNILKKEESFLTEQFKKPMMISLVTGGDIDIGFNQSLYFSGNYRQAGSDRETTVGMAYGFFLDQTGYTVFKLGLWHRLKDALIPYAGFSYEGLQVGCSFDYTVSSKKTRGTVKNAFEVSVLYMRPDLSELRRLIPWY
jgi:type IX secretion system PorP/SprF family membrane protein